jgi:hypothetical protein
MDTRNLERRIAALSDDAQRKVEAFVARLERTEGNDAFPSTDTGDADPSFVGMWADRDDMSDSVAWTRRVRADEWRTPGD